MKKTVNYVPGASDIIEVGRSAFVFPTNHPGAGVTNTQQVMTSRVIRKEDDGTFETQNTIYVPLPNA